MDKGRFLLLRCFTAVYFKFSVLGEQEVIRLLRALVEQVIGGLYSPLLYQHLSASVCVPPRVN